MKFFHDKKAPWSEKWNWVDENNVVLGFDASQCCCEDFGSYYHTDPKEPKETEIELSEEDLKDYRFDPEFHEDDNLGDTDGGGSFTVKLVDSTGTSNRPEVYLTIYNWHNGYYSHGFSFDNGETTIYSGCL